MADRLDLHAKFEEILESNNVYFQPPANVRMKYPAIVYSLDNFLIKRANNASYITVPGYSVILITDDPDNGFVEKILQLPHCRFNQFYEAENLNHYKFTIY